jgi:hypothetical protein
VKGAVSLLNMGEEGELEFFRGAGVRRGTRGTLAALERRSR